MGQQPSKYQGGAGPVVVQQGPYTAGPYSSKRPVAYIQNNAPPPPQGQLIVNNPPPGSNYMPSAIRSAPGQLPRRSDVLPPGFEREMRSMEQDFWDDDGPVLPQTGRPPPVGPWMNRGPPGPYPPGRLPRQRGPAGQMIDNMRQNGFSGDLMGGNFMDGMLPDPNQYRPARPAPAPASNVQGYAQQTSNQPQSVQPQILIYDPATGQMTNAQQSTGAMPQQVITQTSPQGYPGGAPQIYTMPQSNQQTPQVITIPQGGTQQQAYNIPQIPSGIPGMPQISWAMPQQNAQPQAAPQPFVIPGQAYGGANLYTGYNQQ